MWLSWLNNRNSSNERTLSFNIKPLKYTLIVFFWGCVYPSHSLSQVSTLTDGMIKTTIEELISRKEYFNAIFKIDTLLKSEQGITDLTYFSERQLFCFTKLSYELDFNDRFYSTYNKIRFNHKKNEYFQKFLITSANGFLHFEKTKKCRHLLNKVRISALQTEDELESYHLVVALSRDKIRKEETIFRHAFGHSVSEGLHEKGFDYITRLHKIPKTLKISILEAYIDQKMSLFKQIDPDLDAFIGEDFWSCLLNSLIAVKGSDVNLHMLYYLERANYELRKGNISLANYFLDNIYELEYDSFTDFEMNKFRPYRNEDVQISFLHSKIKSGKQFTTSDFEIFTILSMNHSYLRQTWGSYDSLIQIAIYFLDHTNKFETETYQLAINSAKLLLYFSEYGYDHHGQFTSLPTYNDIHLKLVNYLIKEQQIWCHDPRTLTNLYELKAQAYNQMPNKYERTSQTFLPHDSAYEYAQLALDKNRNLNYSDLNKISTKNNACINILNIKNSKIAYYNDTLVRKYLISQIINETGRAYYSCLFKFRSEYAHRVSRDIWDRDFFSKSFNYLSSDIDKADSSTRDSLVLYGYYNYSMNWLLSTGNITTYLISDIFNTSNHLKHYYDFKTLKKINAIDFKNQYLQFIDSQIICWNTDQNVKKADLLAKQLRANPSFRHYHNNQLWLKWTDIQKKIQLNDGLIFVLPEQVNNYIRFQILYFDKTATYVNCKFTRYYDREVCFNPKAIGSVYRDTGSLCLYQIIEKIGTNHSNNYLLHSGEAANINYQIIGRFKRPKEETLISYRLIPCEHTRAIKKQKEIGKTEISSALFVGNLDYSKPNFYDNSDQENNYVITRGDRSSQKGMAWESLPATKVEIENSSSVLNCTTKKILQGNTINTDSIAKWTSTNKNYILHIATHGYNTLTKQNNTSNPVLNVFSNENSNYKIHPLLETGLVLSNANSGERNSICAAIDIIKMNLSSCQLCVLSACNSGTTKITIDGQNHGLKRALKIAGVKNVITSLWPIPDEETSIFFMTFYRNLNLSRNIQTAFRNTQIELSKTYDFYFWGAFILDNFETDPIIF